MSYIINKTDGTILTEVIDGSIDQTSTDITLIGKNATTYGELFNENFVHMLENFANTNQPSNPIQGQLWYDTSEARLKVYDGNGFKVSGGTIVSNTIPSTITQGDIWIDSYRKQMFFNDGVSTLLAGPQYTAQQGISGTNVVDVVDTSGLSHTVVLIYVAQVLIGLFSKDAFDPGTTIPGYTGLVEIGFNVSNYLGVKFNVPVTKAESLIAADGVLKTVEDFVPIGESSSINGSLTLLSTTPLVLGTNQSNEVKVSTSLMQINSNSINQNFVINSLSGSGLSASLFINANNKYVGLFTDTPTSSLDVNGNARIRGNLVVEGDTTSINTTNLAVEDLLIELGKVDSPSNSTANGGGISLEGGTDGDKTLVWNNSTSAWTSSENINLASGKSYQIEGFSVLTKTSLGTTVTSAPGLTSVGTLSSLQVSKLNLSTNVISYQDPLTGDADIIITPKGTGAVNVSSKKITNLANPTNDLDGVNLQTLVTKVETAPLGLSINVGSLTGPQIITKILNNVYPVSEHQDGTVCRVWCIDLGNLVKVFTLSAGSWTGPVDVAVV